MSSEIFDQDDNWDDADGDEIILDEDSGEAFRRYKTPVTDGVYEEHEVDSVDGEYPTWERVTSFEGDTLISQRLIIYADKGVPEMCLTAFPGAFDDAKRGIPCFLYVSIRDSRLEAVPVLQENQEAGPIPNVNLVYYLSGESHLESITFALPKSAKAGLAEAVPWRDGIRAIYDKYDGDTADTKLLEDLNRMKTLTRQEAHKHVAAERIHSGKALSREDEAVLETILEDIGQFIDFAPIPQDIVKIIYNFGFFPFMRMQFFRAMRVMSQDENLEESDEEIVTPFSRCLASLLNGKKQGIHFPDSVHEETLNRLLDMAFAEFITWVEQFDQRVDRDDTFVDLLVYPHRILGGSHVVTKTEEDNGQVTRREIARRAMRRERAVRSQVVFPITDNRGKFRIDGTSRNGWRQYRWEIPGCEHSWEGEVLDTLDGEFLKIIVHAMTQGTLPDDEVFDLSSFWKYHFPE